MGIYTGIEIIDTGFLIETGYSKEYCLKKINQFLENNKEKSKAKLIVKLISEMENEWDDENYKASIWLHNIDRKVIHVDNYISIEKSDEDFIVN